MRSKRVLVVEDDALVSMAVEAEVADAGHAVVGPFGCCADALASLSSDGLPDAAVLDFRLRDGPCLDLARALRQRGVPFLVYTGSLPSAKPCGPLEGAPWIEKPAPTGRLAAALDALLRAHALAA
jgi:DNA-binding response OmpR family regulator